MFDRTFSAYAKELDIKSFPVNTACCFCTEKLELPIRIVFQHFPVPLLTSRGACSISDPYVLYKFKQGSLFSPLDRTDQF